MAKFSLLFTFENMAISFFIYFNLYFIFFLALPKGRAFHFIFFTSLRRKFLIFCGNLLIRRDYFVVPPRNDDHLLE